MRIGQERLKTISEISVDIAQVFFASILIEPITNHSANPFIITAGLLLSLIFWGLGIIAIRE